jgi:hypothetical protein
MWFQKEPLWDYFLGVCGDKYRLHWVTIFRILGNQVAIPKAQLNKLLIIVSHTVPTPQEITNSLREAQYFRGVFMGKKPFSEKPWR